MPTVDWEETVFEIQRVEWGWIFAEIRSGETTVALRNSYLGGLDMPQTLLRILTELLEGAGREQSRWICWHGEGDSYLWHLEAGDQVLKLGIYQGGCSVGLPLEGGVLQARAESAVLLLEVETPLWSFARSVCDALGRYCRGPGFAQWQSSYYRDHFPEGAYRALRGALRG